MTTTHHLITRPIIRISTGDAAEDLGIPHGEFDRTTLKINGKRHSVSYSECDDAWFGAIYPKTNYNGYALLRAGL